MRRANVWRRPVPSAECRTYRLLRHTQTTNHKRHFESLFLISAVVCSSVFHCSAGRILEPSAFPIFTSLCTRTWELPFPHHCLWRTNTRIDQHGSRHTCAGKFGGFQRTTETKSWPTSRTWKRSYIIIARLSSCQYRSRTRGRGSCDRRCKTCRPTTARSWRTASTRSAASSRKSHDS
jgi:hypothetical protein